eukprot:TRINITY_DN4243_c0_g1_i10.p1 TRINITY_DN4243_c0_g1~~TRINITY_DN4243_c0_g1_i10.p1  ORF type:complete len:199 (-),score=35.37 TRINITY_DN4243_c0_g1_i10:3-599(-)
MCIRDRQYVKPVREEQVSQLLKPVENFTAKQLSGKWFQIARLGTWINSDLYNVTQEFIFNEKRNTFKIAIGGRIAAAVGDKEVLEGKASPIDGQYSKLQVDFLWQMKLQYIVIDAATDNSWLLIGTEDRQYAFILTKKPYLQDSLKNRLVGKLQQNGFSVKSINYTMQKYKTIWSIQLLTSNLLSQYLLYFLLSLIHI